MSKQVTKALSWTVIALSFAVVVGSIRYISIQMQGPTGGAAPNAAEWLSAISTFWGALAGGIGAVGTAGALWLGAVTFYRQVRDQHSAQAATVSILVSYVSNQPNKRLLSVRNDSQLPIYDVR